MKSRRYWQWFALAASAVLIAFYHFRMIGEDTPIHSLHYRLNYLPILLAAIWFGLRGGAVTAAVITAVYLPHAVLGHGVGHHSPQLNTYLEFVLYNVVGWVVGWLVSARIKDQQRFDHAKQLATLGEFAAGVVHEIKNPVQTIQGALDLVRNRPLDADTAEILGMAREEASRLDRFAQDFLALAKPPSPHRMDADVTQLVRNSIERVRLARSGKMPVVELVTLKTAFRAECDPEQIEQALWNVIENATDAAGVDGRIRVSLTAQGSMIQIEVEDSGPGVAGEDVERIFEPFRTKRAGGTGLGLPISRAILEAHGGRITCRSGSLGGAAFRLEFPQ